MARERGGPDVCPLHRRQGREGGSESPSSDQVDWAGLPVNLDLVFSQQQRDKVYVQHLLRKRGTQPWGWLQSGAQPCACDAAADGGRRSPDAAESMSSR